MRLWPWIVALLIAVVLPWLFYDWQHGRHSGFMISVFSQMGMMIIFALSFNMLMGQAGLLSFCHSVLFGLAGPAVLSYLTWETAKIRSTQSATGILYVDFFTVVVGEVLAKYLLLATRVAV